MSGPCHECVGATSAAVFARRGGERGRAAGRPRASRAGDAPKSSHTLQHQRLPVMGSSPQRSQLYCSSFLGMHGSNIARGGVKNGGARGDSTRGRRWTRRRSVVRARRGPSSVHSAKGEVRLLGGARGVMNTFHGGKCRRVVRSPSPAVRASTIIFRYDEILSIARVPRPESPGASNERRLGLIPRFRSHPVDPLWTPPVIESSP